MYCSDEEEGSNFSVFKMRENSMGLYVAGKDPGKVKKTCKKMKSGSVSCSVMYDSLQPHGL